MKTFFKKFLAILILSQITLPGGVMAFVPQNLDEDNLPYAKWEIIIKYKDSYANFAVPNNVVEFEKNIEKSGREVTQVWTDENMAVITDEIGVFEKILLQVQWLPERDIVPEMIKIYEANPNVEFVQPNYIYRFNTNILDENLENNLEKISEENEEIEENSWEITEENFSDNLDIKNSENNEKTEENNNSEENFANSENSEKISENKNIENTEKNSENNSEENNEIEENSEENSEENKSEKISENNEENEENKENKNSEENKVIDKYQEKISQKNSNSKIEVFFPNQDNQDSNIANSVFNENIFVPSSVENAWEENLLTQKFNDKYAKHQWYLHNVGQESPGWWEPFIGIPGVDIWYLNAKKIYDIAKSRQSEEQRNKKIVVAVMDSLVDFSHPDLSHSRWSRDTCLNINNVTEYNCTGFDADTLSTNPDNIGISHGTLVSSTIFAKPNNSEWTIGIAPDDVEIMSISVTKTGQISSEEMINAFSFAAKNNAEILNFSIWTGLEKIVSWKVFPCESAPCSVSDSWTRDRIDIALYNAMRNFPGFIVAAASNRRSGDITGDLEEVANDHYYSMPSIYKAWFYYYNKNYLWINDSKMIIIWNSDAQWAISSNSYYWRRFVDLFAPGHNIITSFPVTLSNSTKNSRYMQGDGIGPYDINVWTSLSSPIVVASLVFAKSAYPNKTFPELAQIMKETVTVNDNFRGKAISNGTLNLGAMMERLENDAGYNATSPTGNITASLDNSRNFVKLTLRTNKIVNVPSPWVKVNDTTYELNVNRNWEISVEISDNYDQKQIIRHTVSGIVERFNANISANTTDWTKDSVTLTITMNKPVPVPNDWTRIDDLTYAKIVTENWNYWLTLTDNSDNSSVRLEYNVNKIDKTAPNLTITNSNHNSTLSGTTTQISFSATDNLSGIKSYKCKTNQSPWQTCNSPFNWLLENEWENIFQIKAIDNVDNESNPEIIRVNRDTTGVNISRIENQELWLNIAINPIIIHTEENSRLEVVWLPEWLELNNSRISGTPKISGNFPVTIRAYDNVGNVSELIFSIIVKDKTPPTISINWNKYTSTGSVINIKNQNLSLNKPITPIVLSLNEWWDIVVDGLPDGLIFDSNTNTISWTPAWIIRSTINITATDIEGNITNIRFDIIVNDDIAPVIQINGSNYIRHNSNENYIDAGATCVDDIDSVCTVKVQNYFTNSPWQNKIIYTATDSAGNVSTATRIVEVYSIWPGGPSFGGSNSWDLDYRNNDLSILSNSPNSSDSSNLLTLNSAANNQNLFFNFNETNDNFLNNLEKSSMNYTRKMSILSGYASYYFVKIFDEKSQLSPSDRQKYIQEYIEILQLAQKINSNNFENWESFGKIFYILDIEK